MCYGKNITNLKHKFFMFCLQFLLLSLWYIYDRRLQIDSTYITQGSLLCALRLVNVWLGIF